VRTAGTGTFAPLDDLAPVTPDTNTSCPGSWSLDGNAGNPSGSYLGTADSATFVIKSNSTQVAEAYTVSSNPVWIGGGAENASFGGKGAFIGGGGSVSDVSKRNGVGPFSAVVGGDTNEAGKGAANGYAFIGGGSANTADADYATIDGGISNEASAAGATVGGGVGNSASGTGATIAGGGGFGSTCGLRANDFCIGNTASGDHSSIGGGDNNQATGVQSAIGGGSGNETDGNLATISGGYANFASGTYSTVAGGYANHAAGNNSAAIGFFSYAGGDYSFVTGADMHVRDASETGTAGGDSGTFMWGDKNDSNVELSSSGQNQFIVRANGGVAINEAPFNPDIELTIAANATGLNYPNLWLKQRGLFGDGIIISVGDGASNSNNAGFYIDNYDGSTQKRRMQLANDGSAFIHSNTSGGNSGVTLAANAGSWSSLSDRHVKTAIAAIDPLDILNRLTKMPVSAWSYIAQGEGIRHIGPMAQDFSAAFSFGEDDTHISTVDADGVAFAAIQGLNQKLEAENSELHSKLDEVLARLSKLETTKGQ